jgi:hypothetical protein
MGARASFIRDLGVVFLPGQRKPKRLSLLSVGPRGGSLRVRAPELVFGLLIPLKLPEDGGLALLDRPRVDLRRQPPAPVSLGALSHENDDTAVVGNIPVLTEIERLLGAEGHLDGDYGNGTRIMSQDGSDVCVTVV